MPTYSYRCPKCGHEYEKLQKMSDTTLIKCPECGAKGERLISAGAGILFKGSGFYETDYKRAGRPSKTEVVNATKPKDDKKSSSSDSKKKTSKSKVKKGPDS